mgnify:CR=1 FL=1
MDVADCALVIVTAGRGRSRGRPGWTSSARTLPSSRGYRGDHRPGLRGHSAGGVQPRGRAYLCRLEAVGLSQKPGHWLGHGAGHRRLKQILGEKLGVDSRNVHAAILGEHGDSELAVWSSANISSIDLDRFCQLRGRPDRAGLDRIYARCGTAPMRSSAVRGHLLRDRHGCGPNRRVHRPG